MKYKKNYIIAIDGPAGSGKSTIAKLLAKKLDFLYIDSGAMYRAVTLYLIQKKTLNAPAKEIKKCLKDIKIDFEVRARLVRVQEIPKNRILLNGRDVTTKIRSSFVNKQVSYVSSLKVIRYEMTKRQKEFAKYNFVIMDGRDIGTKVFPEANLKIYLTASNYIRAKRRLHDLKKLGEKYNLNEVIKQVDERDNFDSSRNISPLSKAQDAIVIDTSVLSIDQVLEKIYFFVPQSPCLFLSFK